MRKSTEVATGPNWGDSKWSPVVITEGLNQDTGIREDDDLSRATELIHGFTSQGTGVLLTPTDVAEIKVSSRDTWTPAQLADAEFEVRRALLPAVMYDRGRDGRRLEGTLVMPLNTDDGCHATDVEYVAFINLEGSIAGQKVGRYGCFRIQPVTVDKRGVLHEVRLNDRGYLDGRSVHAGMLEGFIKGYSTLDDACEAADELRKALTTLRNASRVSEVSEEREFTDRTAPRSIGF